MSLTRVKNLLMQMGLNEYQASALTYILYLGEVKASTLSKVSGVPSSRIYNILDELVRIGLITVKPGRPATYSPRNPEDVAGALISSGIRELKERLSALERYAKEFVESSRDIYLKGAKREVAAPLLRVVSVGDVSLEETRKMYTTAKREIMVISKVFEYLPKVFEELSDAVKRGVKVRVILLDPSRLQEESRRVQEENLAMMEKEFGDRLEVRFFPDLPLRGCIIDPEGNGCALFLVEEPGVPLFLREAAITTHHNLVRALSLMFELMWEKSEPYKQRAS